MSSKNRGCPECRGVMDFRLGEYVCPNCGHTQPASQPKEEQQATGPGFRSEQQYGAAGAKPPPGAAPGSPKKGTVFSLLVDHKFGKEKPNQPRFHTFLQTEKHIFFSLSIVGSLVKAFGAGFQPNPGDAALGMAWSNLGLAVWLLALGFALYGSELLAKQACMGCAGLQLVGTIGSVFYIKTMFGQFTSPGLAGGASFTGVLITLFVAFGVVWQVWLIWILYRDSQYLQ